MFRKSLFGGYNHEDVLKYVQEMHEKLSEAQLRMNEIQEKLAGSEEKIKSAEAEKQATAEMCSELVAGCKLQITEQTDTIRDLSDQLEQNKLDYERLKAQEGETVKLLDFLNRSQGEVQEIISRAEGEAEEIVETARNEALSFREETVTAVLEVKTTLETAENILESVTKKADEFIGGSTAADSGALSKINDLVAKAQSGSEAEDSFAENESDESGAKDSESPEAAPVYDSFEDYTPGHIEAAEPEQNEYTEPEQEEPEYSVRELDEPEEAEPDYAIREYDDAEDDEPIYAMREYDEPEQSGEDYEIPDEEDEPVVYDSADEISTPKGDYDPYAIDRLLKAAQNIGNSLGVELPGMPEYTARRSEPEPDEEDEAFDNSHIEDQLPALDEELLKIIANLRAFGTDK